MEINRRNVLAGALGAGVVLGAGGCADPAPYRPDALSLRWDPPSRIRTLPGDGDNWPATLASDGRLYTAYGDGYGFGGRRRLSLGFARVTGTPFSGMMHGTSIRSNIDASGGNAEGIKASGLIEDHGELFCFVRNYEVAGSYRHSRLARSGDLGRTWTWVRWHFTTSFGCPDFVQGASDAAYTYLVSQDNNDAYRHSLDVVLARIPRGRIADRSAYEFFAGTSSSPAWTADITKRRPIFHDRNGTLRVSMSYNAPLGLYFLVSSHGSGLGALRNGSLGVFASRAPWGPWRTLYYSNNWSPGISYEQKFPPHYMSADGRQMWCLYSGRRGTPYKFTLRRAVLV